MLDPHTERMMMGAAGAAGGATYVDDVFSTYLTRGTGSTKTINNGIDLSGEGGLVWQKCRSIGQEHLLIDSERGLTKVIKSNSNSSEFTASTSITSFNNNGFTTGSYGDSNQVNQDYATWTFRKAPGFFDVVTFTQASGTPTNQRISHGLGSAPGMIWMKCTSGTRDWFCYHRSLGKDKYFKLNDTGAAANATNGWGTSEPDATEFGFNANEFGVSTGSTYVAYLFAHDVQSFGEEGDQSIIKCGTFSRSGSLTDVDIGFEPQFVFHTMYEGPSSRGLVDSMRGFLSTENSRFLKAQTNTAENNTVTRLLSAKGFAQGGDMGNYIYMAIRRPDGLVGKPAEAGTDAFALATGRTDNVRPTFTSGFPVDFNLYRKPATTQSWYTNARLLGQKILFTDSSGVEQTSGTDDFDFNTGMGQWTGDQSAYQSWMWKRGAGFDVVSFVSQGGSGTSFNHSLGRVPEMMWFKNRDRASTDWFVYHKDLHASNPEKYKLELNNGDAVDGPVNDYFEYNGGAGITATTASGGGFYETGGASGNDMLCLLFASVDGISKCGYYDGSSSNQTITTGFQPRFVIIKCTTNVTNWLILDTTRGWGSGNDKMLYPDATWAQDTNVDAGSPVSTGFVVNTGPGTIINSSGAKYIYYAHA